ncbi:MAG: S8 family serine peptidase, partial [Anaerolineae bacterium]
MKSVRFFSLFITLVLALSSLATPAVAKPAAEPANLAAVDKIQADLLDAFAAEGSANFFVVMAEKADLSAANGIADWSARGHYVYDTLREVAARSQAPVIAYAQEHDLAYRSFLTVNSVYFQSGTLQIAEDLAALPGVDYLRLEGEAYIQPGDEIDASPDAPGWNLDLLNPGEDLYGMQAAQVWNLYGVRGDGVVVANIDTGAYYEHEALVGQYRGNEGDGTFDHDFDWYMPTYGCDDSNGPCDNDGHGSGTVGIMAGQTPDFAEQIGVAPAAEWIACKGCEENSCSDAALTGCADWMLAPCPFQVDPGDPACDPDMRPHIVNNSWGGGGCSTWYRSYVQAWVASGIFPAFSAGNTVGCGTLGSPGDNPESFGTAAHSSAGLNLYAGGPSCFFPNPSCDPDAHEVDPHLNAPTFGRTAGNTQGEYYNLSGTSGASPHTAGAVALIWSANPAYIGDILGTFTILEQSTNHDVPLGNCGKPACAGDNNWPNYEYGWGYLDALAAVEMAGAPEVDQGLLDGYVYDADTGDPIAGATVNAVPGLLAANPNATTDPTGYYTITLVVGTYDVTASALGYVDMSVTGIEILTDTVTSQDFALELEPGWRLGPDLYDCFDLTRFDAEFFPADGMVYLLGGRSGNDTIGNIYQFDPTTGACSDTGTDMPTPISNYTANLVNDGTDDLLCTFGGRNSAGGQTLDVQCYDPIANTASVVNTLPTEWTGFGPGAQAVVDNQVYIFGGFRSTSAPYTTGRTDRYDPVTNTFEQLGDLSLARS